MNNFLRTTRIYGNRLPISSQLSTSIYNWNRPKHGPIVQAALWLNSELSKHYSKEVGYGKQMGGFEYKEDIEGFKSLWRTPISERESIWKSKLALFGTKKFAANLIKFNPANFKFFSLAQISLYIGKKKMLRDQEVKTERLNILGCDLAAAHFVVFRGGAVKFCHQSSWILDDKESKSDYDDDLPNSYDPDYLLEAIDFSGTVIIYEGLKILENLESLKWLSFSCCPYFDNFCLDRVSGEFCERLEYLDISYTRVTHHGLNALYRFEHLKTLKVEGFFDDPEFWLTCQELKKAFPSLEIEGISDEMPSIEVTNEVLKTAS